MPRRSRIRWTLGVGLAALAAACGRPASAPPAAPQSAAAVPAVPSGTIVAFYGTEIPAGWVLCDGSVTASGKLTPDLRNRFIMGLEPGTGALGETGGSLSHTHSARLGQATKDTEVEKGDDKDVATDEHTHAITVDSSLHLPPYVKLVYIMKE